jgi:hypothetical protein
MTTGNRLSSNPGFVVCVLLVFSLPFIGVGVWLCMEFGSTIGAYRAAQRWEESPAHILDVAMQNVDSGEGMSYKVTASYVYEYKGREYAGKRVSIYTGSDNIGSFQFDAYHELQGYWRAGKPFRCYVNPTQPTEAVLYRDLRWEMVLFQTALAFAFSGGGIGLMVFAVCGCVLQRRRNRAIAANPDRPWAWRKDWADGAIRSSADSLLRPLACTLIWNLFSLPLGALLLRAVINNGSWHAALGMVFPGIGLLLVHWLTVVLLRRRKFGPSVFQMSAVPGVIGGRLAGVIQTSTKIRPKGGFRLVLNCIQKMPSVGTDTTDRTTWQEEQLIVRELLPDDAGHSAIPVLFQIPYKCDETNAEDGTRWQIEVTAAVPGVDYRATFDVPVFKTAASDPDFMPDPAAIAAYTLPADPERDLRDAGVIKEALPDDEGFRFIFPTWRRRGITRFAIGFFVVCSLAAVLSLYQGAWFDVPLLLGVLAALALMFLRKIGFYRSVVDVSNRGLAITGGPFGQGDCCWIDVADIARLEIDGIANPYYNLILVCCDEERITIGKWLPGPRLIRSVMQQIEQALGARRGDAKSPSDRASQ